MGLYEVPLSVSLLGFGVRFCYGALLSRLLEISAIKIPYYYHILQFDI